MHPAHEQKCIKTYRDIPFAHRAHGHTGHCRFVHGHSWAFTFVFSGVPDPVTGFVLDYGGDFMKGVRRMIDEKFDHAIVINESDERGREMLEAFPDCFKPLIVPACSAEGIARYLYMLLASSVSDATDGRVRLVQVVVNEDSRNSAEFTAP